MTHLSQTTTVTTGPSFCYIFYYFERYNHFGNFSGGHDHYSTIRAISYPPLPRKSSEIFRDYLLDTGKYSDRFHKCVTRDQRSQAAVEWGSES